MAKKVLAVILIMQLCGVGLYAQDYNPLSKFARGISNATLGWVEIFRQPIKVKEEHGDGAGDVAGFFWGPAKGIFYFFGRTLLGVYEAATCLVPPYTPLVQPEYIFSEEEEVEAY